jgi:hypothetical protein
MHPVEDETTGGRSRRRRRAKGRRVSPDGVEQPANGGGSDASADRRADRESRGLHDLVGSGPSQLGVSGALRGRDVCRPSDDDLAAAERDLVIVRRNWTPPQPS